MARKSAYRNQSATSGDIEQWAISILLECHAIQRCPDHGYVRDRTDPDARQQAREIAETEPYSGLTPQEARNAINHALQWIGDTCPEC